MSAKETEAHKSAPRKDKKKVDGNDQPVNVGDTGTVPGLKKKRGNSAPPGKLSITINSAQQIVNPSPGDKAYKIKLSSGYSPACISGNALLPTDSWDLFLLDPTNGTLVISYPGNGNFMRIHDQDPDKGSATELDYLLTPEAAVLVINGQTPVVLTPGAPSTTSAFAVIHTCPTGQKCPC